MELATSVKLVSQSEAAKVKLTSRSARGECGPQVKGLAGEKVQGYRRRVRNLVERMECAGSDLLVDEYARLAQASPVIQALLVEQVQCADPDPGRPVPSFRLRGCLITRIE